MSFLFGSKKSAQTAKDRLQIILAHERSANIPYLEDMKKEIEAIVQKYTKSKQITFSTNSTHHNLQTLELEITLG